jgi:outer membrane protein OmpA-like peptidoglycan-associated protein
MSENIWKKAGFLFLPGAFFLILSQGCVATRSWVTEQLTPVAGRVGETENRLGQVGGRVSNVEGKLGQAEGKLGQVEGKLDQVGGQVKDVDGRLIQTDAKAEKALSNFANLRLERRFVLNLHEGAIFAFNSAKLTDEAKRGIDGLFSDLPGELKDAGTIFLIAGHTDSSGPEDYNYELGQKRAASVARYLITQKKVEPLRVATVSYGESAPVTDNKSRDGKRRNRRIEILVYKEGTTFSPAGTGPRSEAEKPSAADTRLGGR